jgi:hypothetical protein
MVSDLVLAIDAQIQYGEDLETRDRYPVEVDRDEEEEGEDRLNGS